MKDRKYIVVSDEEMAVQKGYISAIRDALNREMRYCIVTLGCQTNAHDSETIAGMLDEMGMTPAESREQADLVLYNTCCVRENAENKALGNVIWLKELKALKPDLICFTGDLVSRDYTELEPLLPILKQLQAKDGVVSIMGNHDYDPYESHLPARERQQKVERLQEMERDELGWRLLLNEHLIVHRGADSMAVIGVENQSCGAHRIIRRGRLAEAMAGTEGLFSILMSHDPSHWRAEVVGQTSIPLTLSGHTHAMQMRLMGFTPSKWIYPECDGRYDEGSQTLYVNIGLGGTLPMRIGARPEITLLTLCGK